MAKRVWQPVDCYLRRVLPLRYGGDFSDWPPTKAEAIPDKPDVCGFITSKGSPCTRTKPCKFKSHRTVNHDLHSRRSPQDLEEILKERISRYRRERGET